MSDEMNPYVSPKVAEAPLQYEFDVKAPPRPWASRAITAALFMNIVAIPLSELLPDVRRSLERLGAPALWIDMVKACGLINIVWLMVMWPITSLTAVIYTASVDRYTRWWRFKSVTAAIMLALWMLGCGLILSMVMSTSADELD
ncbi:MAG: hypothetical protein SGJ19_11335 [Planctomycetia bacterium]|mgnify:CR=1 FL=1|nr:hypothetical protein [Planctomycetia bacterium]